MRRFFVLAVLLILPCCARANSCVAQASGNWSATATWTSCGGAVPGNGDTAVIGAFNVTVDANTTVGLSGPAINNSAAGTADGGTSSLPQLTLSQTAGGGSLAAGAYYAVFTYVDSASKESLVSAEPSAFTLTSGDTLVVTLPALPAQASSMNLYLSAAGGARNSERLYATGITGTTYDATSSLWNNGTESQSSAPLPPTAAAIWVNPSDVSGSSLTVATGITLTVRGDMVISDATLTLDCGSTFEIDSSASASTTNNPYSILIGDNTYESNPVTFASASGCSSNPWTFTSNVASGAPGSFAPGYYNNGIGNSLSLSLSYGTVSHCGSSIGGCAKLAGQSLSVNSVIFDTTGTLYSGNITAANNLSVTNCTWKNSSDATDAGLEQPVSIYAAAATPSTGSRTVTGNVFDNPPALQFNGATISNNYFDNGYVVPASQAAFTSFTNNLIRLGNIGFIGNAIGAPYGLTNSYLLGDYWPAATVTGTATGGSATTLVDTTKSWTTNAYSATPSNGWMVLITGGTGTNELGQIASNTSNTLTLSNHLAVAPDSTSTYAIYDGMGNIHAIQPTVGGTYSGNIFEATGAYNTGKLLDDSTCGTVTAENNITLPNGTGTLESGMIVNCGSSGSAAVTVLHNTMFEEQVSDWVADYTSLAGQIVSYENNLFWAYSGGPSGTLGPLKLVDNAHPTSGGTSNYVAPANADYNACWNCEAGGYLGNGYSLNLTSQGGAHDVNLSGSTSASGPNFVDPTRNFLTWCESLGLSGLRTTVIANCRADMMKRNDLNGDWNSAFNIAALVSWVTAGFAPQNSALHDTASDGTDIGAVPYQAPASSVVARHQTRVRE